MHEREARNTNKSRAKTEHVLAIDEYVNTSHYVTLMFPADRSKSSCDLVSFFRAQQHGITALSKSTYRILYAAVFITGIIMLHKFTRNTFQAFSSSP